MTVAYDRGQLVELFGDDPRTLAELEREFLDTARLAHGEIGQSDDVAVIARAAHRLKGASGLIGASALHRLAEAVEHAARASDLLAVRRLHATFTQEVDRVAALVSCSSPPRGCVAQ